MSLRRNIVANYLSQGYSTLIGIIMVPLYIRHMGAEAYGLVGFFVMLQAWFALLDLGLTPTVARESASFKGGALAAIDFRRLVRTLEGLFVVIAILGGAALFMASNSIASAWLKANLLPASEVKASVEIMALIVPIRWASGLYRSVISGFERQVWLGGFTCMVATVRFVLVLPVLMYISASPTAFFGYQLCVAVIELVCLFAYAYLLLPQWPQNQSKQIDWSSLSRMSKFSLSVAFASAVWVFTTQSDKLILSKILPLAEYGQFTVAVMAASAINIIGAPVSAAIMPRMARLHAAGDDAGMLRVYRSATQLTTVIAGAAVVTLAICAEPLLWVWTGDSALAKEVAPILTLYAIGNGILAVAAFPYYLQYAKGNLRLHLIGNALFLVLILPAIIWAASRFGGVGAGYAWLAVNLLTFAVWLPIVHHNIEPGLNRQWMGVDIFPIVFTMAVIGYFSSEQIDIAGSRLMQVLQIGLIGTMTMLAGLVASTEARGRLKKWRNGKS